MHIMNGFLTFKMIGTVRIGQYMSMSSCPGFNELQPAILIHWSWDGRYKNIERYNFSAAEENISNK